MFSTFPAALLLVMSKKRFFRHKLVIQKKLLYDYSNNQKGRQRCLTLNHQPSSPKTSALICKLVIQKKLLYKSAKDSSREYKPMTKRMTPEIFTQMLAVFLSSASEAASFCISQLLNPHRFRRTQNPSSTSLSFQ